jgi:hypothetical protein
MTDPWEYAREIRAKNTLELTEEMAMLLSDADALLAVVKLLLKFRGFAVSELLKVVAHDIDINAPDFNESTVKQRRTMWLKDLADKLDREIAALPEHLR